VEIAIAIPMIMKLVKEGKKILKDERREQSSI
jgi:hypothetical protein